MKKLFTISSALMLALGMTVMTACSSENDSVTEEQPVVPEWPAEPSQPELTTRTVTLKASAKMGEETRVAVEGIEGMEDAFKITGWKDGDEVTACYASDDKTILGEVVFTYQEGVFSAQVPDNVELSFFKYAYTGALSNGECSIYLDSKYGYILIDLYLPAVMTPETILLLGNIALSDDKKSLNAELTAPYALACVHNNTDKPLHLVPYGRSHYNNNRGYDYYDGVGIAQNDEPPYRIFKYEYLRDGDYSEIDYDASEVSYEEIQHPITVSARDKAYIPLVRQFNNYTYDMGLINADTGNPVAKLKLLENGKLYKVQFDGEPEEDVEEEDIIPITGTLNDHGYVDLGVVVDGKPLYWATTNIGAEIPADYGLFFAWGETVGFAKNSGTRLFDFEHYSSDLCGGSRNQMKKYCIDEQYGIVDNKTVLEPEDDAAHVNWQAEWRMPTNEEMIALIEQCNWEWTEKPDSEKQKVLGYKVSNKNDPESFIFLPASGYCHPNHDPSSSGYYWTSSLYADAEHYTPINDYSAFHISFDKKWKHTHSLYRCYGCPIRPVWQDKAEVPLTTL